LGFNDLPLLVALGDLVVQRQADVQTLQTEVQDLQERTVNTSENGYPAKWRPGFVAR
jgi:hypothetical protein